MVADIEEQGKLDASEIHARILNAKEILTSKMGEKFFFSIAGGTAELLGRDPEIRESTLRQRLQRVGRRQRNPDGSQPTESKKDAEARNDRWSKETDVESENVPTEESFPVQLKYVM